MASDKGRLPTTEATTENKEPPGVKDDVQAKITKTALSEEKTLGTKEPPPKGRKKSKVEPYSFRPLKKLPEAKRVYGAPRPERGREPLSFDDEGRRKPHALQLLAINDDHTFELNERELAKFLLRPDVKDLHCVIVSVAGAFRKGKSFLLDFFLRYLNAKGKGNWMGDENAPLTGFTWRGGGERNTSGILVWSEIYKIDTPSGEVGVILMDTQGSFDTGSTVRDCATIFALSTMTSSVQVFNLAQNIQEDDLQHLQLFTEYGRLAIAEGDYEGTPFQKLVFLVRDWSYPYDAAYGREGGQELLARRLEVSSNQHEELQFLRQHIRDCFSSLDCFLLPHPGLVVATSPKFDGRTKDIDKEFLKQLKILVPSLLAPENLIVKQINGRKVTCHELLEYIKVYVKIFGSNELPEPKSILMATAEANNLAAVALCREYYSRRMEGICGGDHGYMNPQDLEAYHFMCRDFTKEKFEDTRKMGGKEFSQAYMERLLDDLDDLYNGFKKQNERKNIFTTMKTPASLLTAIVGSYIASSILAMFRLFALANACTVVTSILGAATLLWGYIKYTGDYRQVGKKIDMGAELLYTNVIKPLRNMASPKLLPFLEPPPGSDSERDSGRTSIGEASPRDLWLSETDRERPSGSPYSTFYSPNSPEDTVRGQDHGSRRRRTSGSKSSRSGISRESR